MTVESDVKASLLMRTDKSMCTEQRAADDGDRGFSLRYVCRYVCVQVDDTRIKRNDTAQS